MSALTELALYSQLMRCKGEEVLTAAQIEHHARSLAFVLDVRIGKLEFDGRDDEAARYAAVQDLINRAADILGAMARGESG